MATDIESIACIASEYPDEPPLKFHPVRSRNIVLRKHETVAFKMDDLTLKNGIAMTNRPVELFEPISFKIKETSSTWRDTAIRIGFTNNDPNSIKSVIEHPFLQQNLDVLTSIWTTTLPKELNNVGAVFTYFVDEKGDMYYKLSNKEATFLLGGINTERKVWGVINFYGNTTSIELLEYRLIIKIKNERRRKILKYLNSVSTFLQMDTSQPLLLFLKTTGYITYIYMTGSSENENCNLIGDFTTSAKLFKLLFRLKAFQTISFGKDYDNLIEVFESLTVSPNLKNKTKEFFANKCIICCENQINSVFYRCGHMCMCYECAYSKWQPKNKSECPICKQSVTDIIKVYI